MKEFFLWWVGIEAVGLVAFPLTYAFFRRLPDRGFAFSKVIGLLLLGYGVWAGAVAGLFPNSRGSVILVLLLIAGLSALVAGRHREELTGFLRSGWRYMAFVEVLFFAVLAGAVFIRSFAPEIVWGEKLFELAFLNSIHRSEFFPPNDPWLSGHSISYYYFGYVMISALSKLVALGTNVTFYLALSLMAALASVTAFGLVYNMIAVSRRRREEKAAAEGPALIPRAAVFGLAAAGLMLVVSNLAGIFELMSRHGLGSEGFYGLVGIFGLDGTYDCGAAPAECSEWYPTKFWWWWKATRMGSPFDVQEFPFFSFQFGDLHPHVLVIPFVITLFAVAFQMVLGARVDRDVGEDRGRPYVLPGSVFPWRSVPPALLLGAMVAILALALDVRPALPLVEVRPVFAVLLGLAAAGVELALGALAEANSGGGEGRETLDAPWWICHPVRFLLVGLLLGGMVLVGALAFDLRPDMAVALALLGVAVLAVVGGVAERRVGEGGPESLDALWWARHPGWFLVIGLLLGGIAFIDSWALPLATLMVVAAAAVANWLRTRGQPLRTLGDSVGFTMPVVAAMFLFYLPFYLNLDTDTDVLPRVTQTATTVHPPQDSEATRPLHFLLFWSPLLWVGLSFVAMYVWRRWREVLTRPALVLAAIAWAAPISIWALIILGGDGFGGLADEFAERGANLITLLILIASITAVALSFLHQLRRLAGEQDRGQLFTFYLAGFAFLMMLGAELYFVKDLFNWRLNTVFRFWHQSWIILAIVGGFGLYRLTLGWRLPKLRPGEVPWQRLAGMGVAFGAVYTVLVAVEPWDVLHAKWWTATLGLFVGGVSIVAYAVAAALWNASGPVVWQRLGWLGITTVILAAALVYPVAVTFERTGGFRYPQSMNGLVHVQRGDPVEYEAIQWLDRNVEGTPVILEAVGDDFSDYSRVSARTGLPTVMGWPGHELQWRGFLVEEAAGATPLADRPDEVATIYTTTDVGQAKALLDKYGVEYVFVGRFEREKYGEGGLAKFGEFMIPVFENEGVTIYRMPTQTGDVARLD